MNIESPINIMNCHVSGSFHFLIIQYEKANAISPTIVTDTPLKTGLL